MTEPPGWGLWPLLRCPRRPVGLWNNLCLSRVGFSSDRVKMMFFQGREHLTSQEKRKRGTQVPSDINAWERNSSKDVLSCSDNWGDSHSWIRSVAPGLASISVPALWRVGGVWYKGAVLTGKNHCDWGLLAYIRLSPGTVCLQCIALAIVAAVCCCLPSSGACSGVRWESWGQCPSLALTLTCTVLIFPDVSRNVTARSIWEDCILLNFPLSSVGMLLCLSNLHSMSDSVCTNSCVFMGILQASYCFIMSSRVHRLVNTEIHINASGPTLLLILLYVTDGAFY